MNSLTVKNSENVSKFSKRFTNFINPDKSGQDLGPTAYESFKTVSASFSYVSDMKGASLFSRITGS